jgi:myo-inositol-1(or 4)-monophosphatase
MVHEFGEIVELMKNAARSAGEYLRYAFRTDLKVEFKGEINLITEADVRSEEIIRSILEKADLPIIGEEEGGSADGSKLYFLVDPLDGTTNFSKKIRFYAVSIALMKGIEPLAGVIYLPEFEEVYYAVKNSGAFLETPGGTAQRLKTSDISKLSESVLATGFPYDVWERYEDVLKSLKAMLTSARALRRFGAAAIDLCYVARGIFDGYFEFRLKPWDTAAGSIIVSEAGGRVSDIQGNEYNPSMEEICATNSHIHNELLNVLRSEIMKD